MNFGSPVCVIVDEATEFLLVGSNHLREQFTLRSVGLYGMHVQSVWDGSSNVRFVPACKCGTWARPTRRSPRDPVKLNPPAGMSLLISPKSPPTPTPVALLDEINASELTGEFLERRRNRLAWFAPVRTSLPDLVE